MVGRGPEHRQAGFTLIELMIVIAIIAIIAAIAIPNLLAAKLSSNETSAIATLRNLGSSQLLCQTAGKIDCDSDGVGEFGTLLELTGVVGVRSGYTSTDSPTSSDFTSQRSAINPAPLSPSLSNVNSEGIVTKAGYGFIIFLPDASTPAKFVHESNTGSMTSPTAVLSISGQSGSPLAKVGCDVAETIWCAYATPNQFGNSGNRAFFTGQSADVYQTGNDIGTTHSGSSAAIDGTAAYLGSSITGTIAIGTTGNDGNLWKVVN
ncbi:MAG: type II secretion system protein [Planctomycetota bacterium]|jgi:prepilin-type N-terminal cleavage/methylation domain-containing protein